ncbi:MAG: enoyl-CoA hydratase/isomerase family protein [Bacteroidales bacterium]|nr:enoyl-CoA hydratase/isomerase family protein [Bacteroidales bacterium]
MTVLEFATLSIENRVAYISLNRPEKRNALNPTLVGNLKSLFKEAEASDDVKIIVLKANGDAFCAGADLAYLQTLQTNSYEENLADSNHLKELFEIIYTNKKTVIAQVEGHAIAGGGGLASVCDFVFSVSEAKFGFTEVKIGFVPAIISVFILRKIGEAKTKELLMTGELITANKAKALGLINFVVDREEIEDEVETFAKQLIANCSTDSLELTKKLLADVASMDFKLGLNYASEINAKARSTKDCVKGIASFLNKEAISW